MGAPRITVLRYSRVRFNHLQRGGSDDTLSTLSPGPEETWVIVGKYSISADSRSSIHVSRIPGLSQFDRTSVHADLSGDFDIESGASTVDLTSHPRLLIQTRH